jgi:hypothetical protein
MKITRRQLRRIILRETRILLEGEPDEYPEVPPPLSADEATEVMVVSMNAVNAFLKDQGLHPQFVANPEIQGYNQRIRFHIKTPPGKEKYIMRLLDKNQSTLLDFPNNVAIEYYFEYQRPGRVGVDIATFD